MAEDSVRKDLSKRRTPERTVSTICDLRPEIPEPQRVQSHMLLWSIPVDNLHESRIIKGYVACWLHDLWRSSVGGMVSGSFVSFFEPFS